MLFTRAKLFITLRRAMLPQRVMPHAVTRYDAVAAACHYDASRHDDTADDAKLTLFATPRLMPARYDIATYATTPRFERCCQLYACFTPLMLSSSLRDMPRYATPLS